MGSKKVRLHCFNCLKYFKDLNEMYQHRQVRCVTSKKLVKRFEKAIGKCDGKPTPPTKTNFQAPRTLQKWKNPGVKLGGKVAAPPKVKSNSNSETVLTSVSQANGKTGNEELQLPKKKEAPMEKEKKLKGILKTGKKSEKVVKHVTWKLKFFTESALRQKPQQKRGAVWALRRLIDSAAGQTSPKSKGKVSQPKAGPSKKAEITAPPKDREEGVGISKTAHPAKAKRTPKKRTGTGAKRLGREATALQATPRTLRSTCNRRCGHLHNHTDTRLTRSKAQGDKKQLSKLNATYIRNMPGLVYPTPCTDFTTTYHLNQQAFWLCLVCGESETEMPKHAMICCEKCDVWYHIKCVNIDGTFPEHLPWFCRPCILAAGLMPDQQPN